MPIRKGEPWGSAVPLPADLPTFDNERAAGRWLRSLSDRSDPIAFGLRGGDLARTMGGGGRDRFAGDVVCAPVDLVRVELDGVQHEALSHVVLRRQWWRGRVVLVMNAQYLCALDVAPRSHPNDGRVDVLDIAPEMTLRARLQARRRSRTGTHVPHPHIKVASVSACEFVFNRRATCWVDGVRVGTARKVTVSVAPDALLLYV